MHTECGLGAHGSLNEAMLDVVRIDASKGLKARVRKPYLLKILGEYDISNKIDAIVSDTASVMPALCRELSNKNKWQPCAAHLLNLCAKSKAKKNRRPKGLLYHQQWKAAADEVQKVVTMIRKSSILKGMYTLKVGEKGKALIADVCTRWTSSIQMLRRASEYRTQIEEVLKEALDHKHIKQLPIIHWAEADALITALTPLEEVTTRLQGDTYSTSDELVPFLAGAIEVLQDLSGLAGSAGAILVKNMKFHFKLDDIRGARSASNSSFPKRSIICQKLLFHLLLHFHHNIGTLF